jgi:2-methylcitrate dehydratase PrpD
VFLTDLAEQLDSAAPMVPSEVLDRAAICVLDALACACGGRDMPWSIQARECIAFGASGESTIWAGRGQHAGLADAAFANAVAAHSVLHEDTHIESRVHPGTVVVPAALAVGEYQGSSMADVLRATVVGYEAIAQIANVVLTEDFVDRGWRASGVFGVFGSAAATAHLLGLDQTGVAHALGVASSSSSGICEWAAAGSTEIFFQNANACRAGLVAGLLARCGASGAASAVEGRYGLRTAFGGTSSGTPKPDVQTDRMAVMTTFFKAYPSCALTQESIDAALRIAERGIEPATIAAATIHTSSAAARYPGCDNAVDLSATISRQMSLQFAVAAALTDADLRADRYRGPVDPGIADLAARIDVVADPAADRPYPTRRDATVEVRLRDGRTLAATNRDKVDLTAANVIAKFRDYADPVLGPSATSTVVSALQRPQSCPDVRTLLASLH